MYVLDDGKIIKNRENFKRMGQNSKRFRSKRAEGGGEKDTEYLFLKQHMSFL